MVSRAISLVGWPDAKTHRASLSLIMAFNGNNISTDEVYFGSGVNQQHHTWRHIGKETRINKQYVIHDEIKYISNVLNIIYVIFIIIKFKYK